MRVSVPTFRRNSEPGQPGQENAGSQSCSELGLHLVFASFSLLANLLFEWKELGFFNVVPHGENVPGIWAQVFQLTSQVRVGSCHSLKAFIAGYRRGAQTVVQILQCTAEAAPRHLRLQCGLARWSLPIG